MNPLSFRDDRSSDGPAIAIAVGLDFDIDRDESHSRHANSLGGFPRSVSTAGKTWWINAQNEMWTGGRW